MASLNIWACTRCLSKRVSTWGSIPFSKRSQSLHVAVHFRLWQCQVVSLLAVLWASERSSSYGLHRLAHFCRADKALAVIHR